MVHGDLKKKKKGWKNDITADPSKKNPNHLRNKYISFWLFSEPKARHTCTDVGLYYQNNKHDIRAWG